MEESVRMTIEINGESTSMVWSTLGSRTAKEQNSTGVTGFLFELVMSCKVKLSGFIFRFLDCQEPQPEPELDSEKWPDIQLAPDTTGYLVHP